MSAPAIAVDMGGSHVTCALLRDREILSYQSLEAFDEPLKVVLPRIQAELERQLALQGIVAGDLPRAGAGLLRYHRPGERHR